MGHLDEYFKLVENNKIKCRLNCSFYSKEAILSTAYEFSREFSCMVDQTDAKYWELLIFGADLEQNGDIPSFAEKFLKRLIDNELRCDLDNKTHHIKEVIVSKAFEPINKN